MNLKLAIVLNCDPGGCRVRLLETGQEIEVIYSALAADLIRIGRDQMVAVEMDSVHPAIVWNWYRTTVLTPGEVQAVVDERGVRSRSSSPFRTGETQRSESNEHNIRALVVWRVPDLTPGLSAGEEVWVTDLGEGWEIHDRVVAGEPQNLQDLASYALPRIEAALLSP